jgi:hypothetical protein
LTQAVKNVQTKNVAALNDATTGAYFKGDFNAHCTGTFTASLVIERSFDDGTNWAALSKDLSGTANSFTAPFSVSLHEVEDGVMYRIRCSAYTSGTPALRLSQSMNG